MKKKSFISRFFALLGGLLLIALSACIIAETFFHVPFTAQLGQLLGARTPVPVLLTLLLAILLFVSGVCCLMMLSVRRAAKRAGFVMQQSENGPIGVSMRSIEGLVQTCVRQNPVIARADVSVVSKRDGIVILLNVEEATGVNIPLAVGALQKQIKKYVNDCTGVDVQEVRVMVENTEDEAPESDYAVRTPLAIAAASVAEAPAEAAAETAVQPDIVAPVQQVTEAAEPAAAAEKAVEPDAAVVVQNVPVVVPVMPEIVEEEEDDRPLHQRLFGAPEEPVFVPAPPELMAEPVADVHEAQAEAVQEEVVEEAAEPAAAAEDIDANAVLEVVAAMAEEEAEAEAAEPEESTEEETQLQGEVQE